MTLPGLFVIRQCVRWSRCYRGYHGHTQLCQTGLRSVSTWSRLESAFNSKLERKVNLNPARKNVGLFQIPQLRDHTGFYLLQQSAHHRAEELVTEATSPNRKRKLVQVFDELSDCLCQVADMADFVRVAHPDETFSKAAEEACVSISGLVEKMNTNTDIHRVLSEVLSQGDIVETDSVDRRVAELFMFDFEQSGIHLPEDKRQQFVKLNEDILMLGTYFMQGTQRPIRVSKNMLPEHLRYVFALEGDNIMVTGMFSDHHNDLVREAAYKIYLYPDSHQRELLESLLEARDKLAQLVGFPTYAHRALRGTMGQSPEKVMDFLKSLAAAVKPRAESDFELIKSLKSSSGAASPEVKSWDTAYYSGLYRHRQCNINHKELSAYFSLGSCMEGLNQLMESLFNVRLQYERPEYGEVWSHDVHKLAVQHATEGLLGHIYCDFFERPGKPHTDCHFTIRGGRLKEDGTYQNPVVVLMLNFPPPLGQIPSLLTPGMMENLFHEFGHAMHSMLGRTRYQHVTGTRCPTDFAEVPSILMEYFSNDHRVLSTFARHWQSGEQLSQKEIDQLCSAKQLFNASEMQLQVFYSILDQVYHGHHPLTDDTTNIMKDIQNTYYSLPYEEGTAWQIRFGHFVGYGAKYYAYLMSRAVAARIWHKYFKGNPFDQTSGEHYRETMLAHGGGKSPSVLVKDMLEEEPDTDMFVSSLLNDLAEES